MAEQDVATAGALQAGVDAALLLRAVEQADDAIIVFVRAGTVTYANAAFERMTGLAREAIIGRDVRAIYDADLNAPDLLEGVWAAVGREEVWRGMLLWRHPATRRVRTCRVSQSPVRTPDGAATHFVSVQRDVTDEINHTQAVRQRQSHTLAGRLLGRLLRDVEDARQSILDASARLLERLPAEDACRAALQEVVRDVARLSELTRPLQAMSGRQPLRVESASLNLCLLDVIARVKEAAGDRITIHCDLDDALPAVVVDVAQLSQALANLCLNACEAMPDGGTLAIRTAYSRVREEDAWHMGMPPGPAVRLSVGDTGTGISPHALEHVFEPYFTTKTKGEGSGLGLAAAYATVRQLGGHIEVESELAVGSVFTVWLPIIPPRPLERPAADDIQKLHGNGETLLVVEDEDAVRRILVTQLKRCGYTVLDAADGYAGLACVQEHAREIRLIVCDVLMPRMGGIAMIEKLRSEGVGLPVVFVSGYADIASDRGRALLALPNVACLNKPLALKTFLSKIRELLAT